MPAILLYTQYNFTANPTKIVFVASYYCFPTQQSPTMSESPASTGLTFKGTEPPPPPNPNMGLLETLPKCKTCPRISLPVIFYLKSSSKSMLPLTKKQWQILLLSYTDMLSPWHQVHLLQPYQSHTCPQQTCTPCPS
jgi:hypothetical protein